MPGGKRKLKFNGTFAVFSDGNISSLGTWASKPSKLSCGDRNTFSGITGINGKRSHSYFTPWSLDLSILPVGMQHYSDC